MTSVEKLGDGSPDSEYSGSPKTELTLGLPGGGAGQTKLKRRFSDLSGGDESPPSRRDELVVGWPPVRSHRKNHVTKGCKFVKVAVDGAPYLRKVDLQVFSSYEELLSALVLMFTSLTLTCDVLNESKRVECLGSRGYLPTYKDKDGDWMLVGDVPWKMFVESCKRLRLMKGSETIGLASNCSIFMEGYKHAFVRCKKEVILDCLGQRLAHIDRHWLRCFVLRSYHKYLRVL